MEKVKCPNPKCGRRIFDIEEMPPGKLVLEMRCKVMAFGDFSYYWIADRQGRSFKRLNELFAATGQVGFLASQRVDGKLILAEAVKTMKVKSSASSAS